MPFLWILCKELYPKYLSERLVDYIGTLHMLGVVRLKERTGSPRVLLGISESMWCTYFREEKTTLHWMYILVYKE